MAVFVPLIFLSSAKFNIFKISFDIICDLLIRSVLILNFNSAADSIISFSSISTLRAAERDVESMKVALLMPESADSKVFISDVVFVTSFAIFFMVLSITLRAFCFFVK